MTAVDVWAEIGDALGDRLAGDLREMVRAHEAGSERNQQRAIGPSGIGTPCTRCLARHVLGLTLTRPFDDPWCRILGTAGHAWLDDAANMANAVAALAGKPARWLPEVRVHPDIELLPAGGKVDLFDVDTGTVIDHKIVGDGPLRKYRLNGPGPQYRTQVHTYGKGYDLAGRDVQHVAVAFWKRGGRLSDLYVWTEKFDVTIADAALLRYRTIRDTALALGPAVLPLLPVDASCWDCGGRDV